MTDMGSRTSNIIFLVGFIVYVAIRGVFERRARINEKIVRRLDAVEKTLLFFVGTGSLLLPSSPLCSRLRIIGFQFLLRGRVQH